ncbi:hypothetical protein Tco_0994385 [Tanacetum coccineum]
MEEDSIDYPDEPEDDDEDLEKDDDEDPEEDPSEEHDLEDDDEDPEEDPSEEHEPEDEGTKERSRGARMRLLSHHHHLDTGSYDPYEMTSRRRTRRFLLTAPPPGCDVVESSDVASARAPRGQYDFVNTVKAG